MKKILATTIALILMLQVSFPVISAAFNEIEEEQNKVTNINEENTDSEQDNEDTTNDESTSTSYDDEKTTNDENGETTNNENLNDDENIANTPQLLNEDDETNIENDEAVILDEKVKNSIPELIDANSDGILTKEELASENLYFLYINADNQELDLKGMENITNLKGLSISGLNSKVDFSILKDLNITQLNISGASFETSNLKELKHVQTLSINIYDSACNYDYSEIKELHNLKSFSIYAYNIPCDTIGEINSLESLSIQNYSYNASIDTKSIGKLTNLSELNIYNANCENVSGLENLINLKKLFLEIPPYSEYDIDTLSKMTSIETLNISNINTDINWIKNLINLKSFSLSNYNYIELPEEFFTELNTLNIDSINLSGYYSVDLGELENGKKYEFNYEDIPLINNLISENSKVYVQDYDLVLNNWQENNIDTSCISIENSEKKFSLTPISNDDKSLMVKVKNNENNDVLCIKLKWTNPGDNDEVTLDEDVKKGLISNGADKNGDGILTKAELSSPSLTYLSISNNNNKVLDLNGIENVKYLQYLYVYGIKETTDYTPLSKLPNLKSLYIGGDISDISTLKDLTKLEKFNISCYTYYGFDKKINIDTIKSFPNLKELSLSGSIDMSILKDLQNINKLYVNGSDTDLKDINSLKKLEELSISSSTQYMPSISNLTNLRKLSISFSYNGQLKTDEISQLEKIEELKINNADCSNLSGLEKLTNLQKLDISGYTYNKNSEQDIDTIKKINSLKDLTINSTKDITWIQDLNNIENLTLYGTYYTYNDRTEIDENFLNTINSVPFNVNLQGNFVVDLGKLKVGEKTEKDFNDIPFLKEVNTPNSKIYMPNINLRSNSNQQSDIVIDNENKKIIVNASEFGEKSSSYSIDGWQPYISISFKCFNTVEGDTTKEINIKDENLKNALLENYNIDSDGKITENDMINIENLDLSNKNIENIEGLQYATNAIYVNLSNNKITDASPLIKISNNDNYPMILLKDNYIEDITNLDGANFERIDLSKNYIDFSENSKNLQTVKENITRILGEIYDNDEYLKEYSREDYIQGEINFILGYYIPRQKNISISERDDVLSFEENLKNKLIENGIDANKDGNITKGEMNDFDVNYDVTIDLSNAEITNIENLKYLRFAKKIDLSNNNINNIEPLKECELLYELNLENNKIENLEQLKNLTDIEVINLSNNKITDITPLTLLDKAISYGYDGFWAGGGEPYVLNINLSNNNISNVDSLANLKILTNMDLSNNKIEDISNLKNFNFDNLKENLKEVAEDDFIDELIMEMFKINLSQNYIDLENENNKLAIDYLSNNGISINTSEQKEKSEYEIETDTKSSNYIEEISSLEDGSNVLCKIDEEKTVKKELFDSIKGKDITVVFKDTPEGNVENTEVQWVVNGKDIVNKTNDIDMTVKLNLEEKEQQNYLNIEFADNGLLPCNSTVRIKLSNETQEKIGTSNLKLYYVKDGKYIKMMDDINLTDDGYYDLEIKHNSEYILTNEDLVDNYKGIGDVNADGKINARDAKMVLQYYNGKIELNDEQKTYADMNMDGRINARDAKLILQSYVGK